ncbi:MAG TPA: BlaI/MecI/CopY family transcriptional regulator [Puia sp.]|nr:BlaI/MecI/CopY family transcriptional regulator [Puia sp.]
MDAMKHSLKDGLSPTPTELEILEILWRDGPSTVRAVNEAMNHDGKGGQYTSTLKLMQIMFRKGLVTRDERKVKHVYSAAQAEKKTKGAMLEQFLNTTYNGYASKLVIELLGNRKTSKKDLNEIKEYLKKLDKR